MVCGLAAPTAPALAGGVVTTVPDGPKSDVASGSLHGVITDGATNEPLIGATVRLEGTSLGGITDMDGKFTITGIPKGVYTVVISFVSYKTERIPNAVIEPGQRASLDFTLHPDDEVLEEVVVTAKANRESENMLLLEQKRALLAIEAIGAMELDRKGITTAEAAVQQVSGISKQDGVKNVFVRGLADRYNATYLNGFPIPSDDPEYKNISLDIFDAAMIQNIGVSKAFSSLRGGDVGGATIDITSKQLQGDRLLSLSMGAGGNATLLQADGFYRQDGVDYFGFANRTQPDPSVFSGNTLAPGQGMPFANKLQPIRVTAPVDHNLSFSIGKHFDAGNTPIDLLLVGRHSVGHSYSERISRLFSTSGHSGMWYRDQRGPSYDMETRQILLGDLTLSPGHRHEVRYTGMIIHFGKQYVASQNGYDYEQNQEGSIGPGGEELHSVDQTRQQANDNRLYVNQLSTKWHLMDNLSLSAGTAVNIIRAYEPDRRRLFMNLNPEGWQPAHSKENERFFSSLKEEDYNVRAGLQWKFGENSFLDGGYAGRFIRHHFSSMAYVLTARVTDGIAPDRLSEELNWDAIYSDEHVANKEIPGRFPTADAEPVNNEWYRATKDLHTAYLDAVYQVMPGLTLQAGLRVDLLSQIVSYGVNESERQRTYAGSGSKKWMKPLILPSVNIKYDISDSHSLRLSASRSYSMPRFKEVAGYTYVNINYSSVGDPNVRPSDIISTDLKYDWYLSPSELFSVTLFYKHIKNPLSRVFLATSAGTLAYANPSDLSQVTGVEVELTKDLLNIYHIANEVRHKLSFGIRGSYIHSSMMLDLEPFGFNIPKRRTSLEGSSPWLFNADLSYQYSDAANAYSAAILVDGFSDRINTYGTVGSNENDLVEKGMIHLGVVAQASLGKHFSVKLTGRNLLDSPHRLVQVPSKSLQDSFNPTLNPGVDPSQPQLMTEYRRGISVSLSLGYSF